MSLRSASVLIEAWNGTAWSNITGYYGGTYNATPNAASRLELTFPAKRGKNLNILREGQFIRAKVGLSGLPIYPRFYGFISNRKVSIEAGKSMVSFEALDLLGEAMREYIQYSELGDSIDGMDAGTAIKYIVGSMWPNAVDLPFTAPDTDGIIGMNPLRNIVTEDGFYATTYNTKFALIQQLNELCVIEQYPKTPLPFFLWVDGEGRFHHRPATDLETGTSRLRVQYAKNLVGTTHATRSAKLLTEAVVTGQKDPNDPDGLPFIGSHSEESWVRMEGRWASKFGITWGTSVDDCRDYAMRKVALYRELYEPITVELREAYYLVCGDLVELYNTLIDKVERMRVMEVDIAFHPTDFKVRLVLGAMNYLPTDYI